MSAANSMSKAWPSTSWWRAPDQRMTREKGWRLDSEPKVSHRGFRWRSRSYFRRHDRRGFKGGQSLALPALGTARGKPSLGTGRDDGLPLGAGELAEPLWPSASKTATATGGPSLFGDGALAASTAFFPIPRPACTRSTGRIKHRLNIAVWPRGLSPSQSVGGPPRPPIGAGLGLAINRPA